MDSLILFGQYVIANAPQLVGFILPPIVEVLNKDVRGDKERFTVAILVCLATAVLLNWNKLAYGSPEEVIAYATLVFTESQAVYKLYFANSWLRYKISSGGKNVVDSPIQ